MSQESEPVQKLEGLDPENPRSRVNYPALKVFHDRTEGIFRDARKNPIEYECEACGWNNEKRIQAVWRSDTKIFYSVQETGFWKIGNNFILKEKGAIDIPLRPGQGCEADTTNYIRENNPRIPVRGHCFSWIDSAAAREYNLLAYVDGEPLSEARRKLPWEQQKEIYSQLFEALGELRKLQSTKDYVHTVDGKPAGEGNFIGCENGLFPPTRQAFIDYLATRRRPDPRFTEEELRSFRERLPDYGPLTLTHGDLDLSNLIVKDGKLVAIIDWQRSAFFPVWWEYVQYYRREPTSQKHAVDDYIGYYPEALQWFHDLKKYYPPKMR